MKILVPCKRGPDPDQTLRRKADATGIDAGGVGSGAGTAPKVAHLGGGERKTVLAGA